MKSRSETIVTSDGSIFTSEILPTSWSISWKKRFNREEQSNWSTTRTHHQEASTEPRMEKVNHVICTEQWVSRDWSLIARRCPLIFSLPCRGDLSSEVVWTKPRRRGEESIRLGWRSEGVQWRRGERLSAIEDDRSRWTSTVNQGFGAMARSSVHSSSLLQWAQQGRSREQHSSNVGDQLGVAHWRGSLFSRMWSGNRLSPKQSREGSPTEAD